jgi:hypothetical protein
MADYTDQMSAVNLLRQQAMNTIMQQQGQGGLLGQPQSRLQAGLLGAAQGLAPYMGYSTTPTTFGQAAVAGLTGAAGGIQQQQQQQLKDALTQLQLATELQPKTKEPTEYFKKINEYNRIAGIPVDQRTPSDQNTFEVLQNDLFSNNFDRLIMSSFLQQGVMNPSLLQDPERMQEFFSGAQEMKKLIDQGLPIPTPSEVGKEEDGKGIFDMISGFLSSFGKEEQPKEDQTKEETKIEIPTESFLITSPQYQQIYGNDIKKLIEDTAKSDPTASEEEVIEFLKKQNIIS